MKLKIILLNVLFLSALTIVRGQKLDSIFFNLYTDSLKKGTYNYINVVGRYSDGRYLPLGPKELKFSASGGKFTGNSLYIDSSFAHEKVSVRAEATGHPGLIEETVIWIKKYEMNERLPTVEEILNRQP